MTNLEELQSVNSILESIEGFSFSDDKKASDNAFNQRLDEAIYPDGDKFAVAFGDIQGTVPYRGKFSDAERVLSFKTQEDAQFVATLARNMGLEDGDFIIEGAKSPVSGRWEIRFQSHVVNTMPKMFQGLVDVAQSKSGYLSEGAKGSSPARAPGQQGNGLHDKSGKFTNKSGIKRDGGGSWSLVGSKVKKVMPGKKGVKMRFTKNPCGRLKKKQPASSSNRAPNRCWDGSKSTYMGKSRFKKAVARLKKMKFKSEGTETDVLMSLLEKALSKQ